MANCHDQFIEFDSAITLSDDRKSRLKQSRTKLRNRIRKHFNENRKEDIKPKFYSQGSSEMKTSINPIPRIIEEDGEEKTITKYDTDDGVYFIGDIKDRKTVQTYHNWIRDAVDGHTTIPPIDKNTCVRTLFVDGHHIDQPIYFVSNTKKDDTPCLAHKSKDWTTSDPRKFSDWFNGKANQNEQLRRIVKYLKAWCDFQNFDNDCNKMPTGFVMTIWASNHFASDTKDDLALRNTLENIHSKLILKFECCRPTIPENENVLENYSYKDFFMERLKAFLDSAKQAINETNPKNGCYKWQKHFGNRFACTTAKDEDEGAKSFSSPAIISSNAKSATLNDRFQGY